MVSIKDVREQDFEAILRLNDAEVRQTSVMDLERLRELHALSDYHRIVGIEGEPVAFLLAMRESAPYENENFAWFASRYETFMYVDRIVVRHEFSRRGIGTALYRDLFAFARNSEVGAVVCEYNIEPPNQPSRAFHDTFGFREIGRQRVAGGSKLVSLQAAQA